MSELSLLRSHLQTVCLALGVNDEVPQYVKEMLVDAICLLRRNKRRRQVFTSVRRVRNRFQRVTVRWLKDLFRGLHLAFTVKARLDEFIFIPGLLQTFDALADSALSASVLVMENHLRFMSNFKLLTFWRKEWGDRTQKSWCDLMGLHPSTFSTFKYRWELRPQGVGRGSMVRTALIAYLTDTLLK
eukprot:TRINITY_DN745_c0_g1_i1.p1 TRINITY_DN745_c0_g1~~TRINITY_DN745_c0_g1_i1.p1  ORF type:complete len:186 (-),score=12.29 TRINITY_DN745_c0_g1_i1:81-638(-)